MESAVLLGRQLDKSVSELDFELIIDKVYLYGPGAFGKGSNFNLPPEAIT